MPGFAELVLILIVVLIIFGASKLPEIATFVGRSIENLRRGKKAAASGTPGKPAQSEHGPAPTKQ